MDRVEEPSASSPSGESKQRTLAYANFDSGLHKLLHLFQFMSRGRENFSDELKTKLEPEAKRLIAEIAEIAQLAKGKEASDQEAQTNVQMMVDDLAEKLSKALEPLKYFTGGLLAVREWVPVLLVTTVETYLEDVLIYAAKVDPEIMESSRLTVPYPEVVKAKSLEELKEELKEKLPPQWARNFLHQNRGPKSWIEQLTGMGARGYRPETASEMETLWGVRHLLVHSRGVATPEFVRRNPEIGAKVGESILIRSPQLTAWITVAYHFVDVTDSYFVRRYGPGTVLRK